MSRPALYTINLFKPVWHPYWSKLFFKNNIYCITKGESTVLVFMWHHTWMPSFDPALHCSSSWCHLSRRLISISSVCIARWWAITISSRGCGNTAAVSLRSALGFSSYHHMTIWSVLRTKAVFIPMLLRRIGQMTSMLNFLVRVQNWQLQVMLLCLHTRKAMSLFAKKRFLVWSNHLNSSLVVS